MIPATSGELASGLVGEGRMAEPEDIVTFIENDILEKLHLKEKKFLLQLDQLMKPLILFGL